MSLPIQCRELDAQIQELQDSLQEVGELTGERAKHKAEIVAKNIQIKHEIALLTGRLNACRAAFGGFYSTDVVIVDVSRGGVTFPLEATLRDMSGVVESRAVSGGRLTFQHDPPPPLDSPFAVIIDEASNPTFTGPLFRSRPLPGLFRGSPGNATGAITVIIPPPVTVTSAQLAGSVPLSAIPPIPGIAVTGLTIVPGVGSITLTLFGTLATLWPVTYTYVFGLAPSRDTTDAATTIVDVVPAIGTLSVGGLGLAASTPSGFVSSLVFSSLLRASEPLLRTAVTPLIASMVNATIVKTAATFLGRPLTPFETISMRRIVVLPSGLALFPSIATYGP